jgi:hypothetical protein
MSAVKCFFFFLVSLCGVRLGPLGMSVTVGLWYQLRMIDDDYGAFGGMRIGRGNRSTRRNPASVPLCPPQIPHDLTWDWTRAAAVGSQRLTAWAMARPYVSCYWWLWFVLVCCVHFLTQYGLCQLLSYHVTVQLSLHVHKLAIRGRASYRKSSRLLSIWPTHATSRADSVLASPFYRQYLAVILTQWGCCTGHMLLHTGSTSLLCRNHLAVVQTVTRCSTRNISLLCWQYFALILAISRCCTGNISLLFWQYVTVVLYSNISLYYWQHLALVPAISRCCAGNISPLCQKNFAVVQAKSYCGTSNISRSLAFFIVFSTHLRPPKKS